MEESCLFLLCVRSTQTFFIISPLYRFQQAFFDKESVFPPHFMPDPAKNGAAYGCSSSCSASCTVSAEKRNNSRLTIHFHMSPNGTQLDFFHDRTSPLQIIL